MATQGRFCWYDLMSTDPLRARDFYTRLFGWTVQDIEMGSMGTYHMLHVGERGVGGIVKLDPGEIPSHWMSYVTVRDVDASAKRVEELGGKVVVPISPIPGVGRFLVLADRQGAFVSLLQADREDETRSHDPGNFVWNELQTSDPDDATRFYADLLGWTYKTWEMGGAGTYHLVMRDDKDVGGIMKAQGEYPPLWLPYVHVTDVDGTTDQVKGLGGNVLVPPMDIPDVGRFSVIQDPTGAALALYKSKPRA